MSSDLSHRIRQDEHHHSASLRRFSSVSIFGFSYYWSLKYVPAIDRLRAVCRAAYRAPTCRVLLETRRLSSAYVSCG